MGGSVIGGEKKEDKEGRGIGGGEEEQTHALTIRCRFSEVRARGITYRE